MLEKFSRGLRRRFRIKHFTDAMGEILLSFEQTPIEPLEEDGFKKDAENIRGYFKTVNLDIKMAILKLEEDLRTEHEQKTELNISKTQKAAP